MSDVLPIDARPGHAVDIWALLERSVQANPAPKTIATSKTEEKDGGSSKSSPWKRRLTFGLLDLLGVWIWFYGITKIFVFDIDRAIVDATVPSATYLLGL